MFGGGGAAPLRELYGLHGHKVLHQQIPENWQAHLQLAYTLYRDIYYAFRSQWNHQYHL